MDTRIQLRANIRSLYDIQKLRIAEGNRLVASFRHKLGLDSSEAEENNAQAENILDSLRSDYKRITDGIKRITRTTKIDGEIISEYAELQMIKAYEEKLSSEKTTEKIIDYLLDEMPVYKHFLKSVKGCGTLMSAVIISEIDISKCNSISALHKYAGLDVVTYEKEGETVSEGRCRKSEHLEEKIYINREGKETKTKGITFNPFLKTKLIGVLGASFIKQGGYYREIYDNYKHRLENHPNHKSNYAVYFGQERVSDYFNEEAETIAELKLLEKKINTDEINRMPFLQLIFENGKTIIDGKKHYLISRGKTYHVLLTGKTKGHRHNMAIRYMIKFFLADLWTEWRTLEGLEVRPSYAEGKLGIVHSKPTFHKKAA